MAWMKRGKKLEDPYIIADKCYELRYAKDVSIDMLNSDDLGYSLVREDNQYVRQEVTISEDILEFLPKGVYKIWAKKSYNDVELWPFQTNSFTSLFKLDIVDQVINDFDHFTSEKGRKAYEPPFSSIYKKGVLLWGPPGTGKTSAVHMIIDSIKNRDCVVFYVDSMLPEGFIDELKKDSRLKVFIFEEITETVKFSETKQGFLNFLDGRDSLHNCYVIATTNYPEKLEANLVDRTGRFDELFELSELSNKDKRTCLEHWLQMPVPDEWLDQLKNLSISFLKEIALLMIRDDKSFEEALRKIRKHRELAKRAFAEPSNRVGFMNDDDDIS